MPNLGTPIDPLDMTKAKREWGTEVSGLHEGIKQKGKQKASQMGQTGQTSIGGRGLGPLTKKELDPIYSELTSLGEQPADVYGLKSAGEEQSESDLLTWMSERETWHDATG